jgi:hypothetical protein
MPSTTLVSPKYERFLYFCYDCCPQLCLVDLASSSLPFSNVNESDLDVGGVMKQVILLGSNRKRARMMASRWNLHFNVAFPVFIVFTLSKVRTVVTPPNLLNLKSKIPGIGGKYLNTRPPDLSLLRRFTFRTFVKYETVPNQNHLIHSTRAGLLHVDRHVKHKKFLYIFGKCL